MKRLHDQVVLDKGLERITLTDLRGRPGEVMTLVSMGKTYVLTKHGKDLAVLSKVPGVQLSLEVNRKGVITHVL